MLTEKQVRKTQRMKTLMLNKGQTIKGANPEMDREMQLTKRLEEAKTKNSAF